MANVAITGLPVVSTIANTSVLPVVVSGTTSQISGANLKAYFGNVSVIANGTSYANISSANGNVVISSNNNQWTFDTTGNLTLPGNIFAVKYANGSQVDIVTKFEGSWTVPVGTSTQSFTVDPNEAYYMWVVCNIPNGIITWNATASITNTNVPVVGVQYTWVYNGAGTPIDFTSIPNQFVGTPSVIIRNSAAPSATTNRFDFGINNTSGSPQIVRYGWVRLS